MKPAAQAPEPGYERSDADVRFVLICGGSLGLGIIFSLVVAAWFYRPVARPLGPRQSFRDGPLEESSVARDWREQDALVRQHLENYAWVERPAGLVQIPIQRAMELMVQRNATPGKSR